MRQYPPIHELPVFIADSTLGRLAKWLRLAGMDTRLDPSQPDELRLERISVMEHRVVLTRTKSVFRRLGASRSLFIRSNDVAAQVRQVIDAFHVQREDLRTMTRCAKCNHSLSQIHSHDLIGQVPDYVLQHYETLMSCRGCHRIYWPGTHAARINSIIEGWFTKAVITSPHI